MNIDEKGCMLDDISDILDAFELQLKSKYGADFYIKPEGIIDNIANTEGFMELSLQQQIAFLGKQFDPETAEGDWQDALYERIGVERLAAKPTTFVKQIIGTPGFAGEINSITIRAEGSKAEFVNTDTYIIDDEGNASLDFKSVEDDEISVSENESFQIVEAPDDVSGISETPLAQISIGRGLETDDEFRIRFRSSKALNAKATRNANEANLVKYVDNIAFLKLIDKKTDNTFEPGTLLVIAKHNTTDKNFANAVFESVADGIDLLGDTEIVVKDSSNQDVTINFKNADEINIDITADVKIRKGYYANTVFTKVKNSILSYIEKRIFGLESIIYGTEFIIPVLEVEGVEAVLSILVKKSDDENYSDSISLAKEEVPVFGADRIFLNENS